MNVPSATYRLQFNASFKLADAAVLLEYLQELGISHVYASPLLKARAGSAHGYDVTNPNEINPEIGTLAEFEDFVTRLQRHQLGLMFDIVPNHMAASLENPWWTDVLANGQASEFAAFFDIDWEAGSGKVFLPILQKPYGESLESGELEIQGNALVCNGQRLPIRNVTEFPSDVDELDRIIAAQSYRPAHWRKAADAINYRRFFDVNDLVAIRAQLDAVFNATHSTTLEFVRRGWVQALRIDHVDGLREPKNYLERLPDVYVVVEKILGGRERLRDDWRTNGTTGYDFLNSVNGAFVDERGYAELCRIYSEFTQMQQHFADVARERKRQVIDELFATEVRMLTGQLLALAADHRIARDLTRQEIRDAFVAVTSCLPVYRTYISGSPISDSDRVYVEHAVAAAGWVSSANAVKFLREVLLLDPPSYLSENLGEYLDFVQRWQQFTGAVMAKGLEDTTFYVFNPLISMNDVGGDAENPAIYLGVDTFHQHNLEQRAAHPATMNATSTHDTKRSEDVRARMAVLSEMPDKWEACLDSWSRWNISKVTGHRSPGRNEQVFIYQTLLGAWPISPDRLRAYMVKALREAKTHTSWLNVNEEYERSVLEFVDRIIDPAQSHRFLMDFLRMQKRVAYFGMLNSLAQTLLKIASPGLPDFYQGMELFDYSLADPDNRRPVDFAVRMEALAGLKRGCNPKDLLLDWTAGGIKMFITWKALTFRRNHLELFLDGEYIPLKVEGKRANNVIAFARRLGEQCVIALVPRLCSKLTRAGKPPVGKVWSDTRLVVPPDFPNEFVNLFTGAAGGLPDISAVLSDLPVALLLNSLHGHIGQVTALQ